MTEKEFRKLVTDLEILSDEKNELLEKIYKLEEIIKNKKSDYYNIVGFPIAGIYQRLKAEGIHL